MKLLQRGGVLYLVGRGGSRQADTLAMTRQRTYTRFTARTDAGGRTSLEIEEQRGQRIAKNGGLVKVAGKLNIEAARGAAVVIASHLADAGLKLLVRGGGHAGGSLGCGAARFAISADQVDGSAVL